MANKVKQFRFYNDAEARKGDASNNSPKTAEKAQFVDGTIFSDCFPISQLGIQALPGTQFYVNSSNNFIIWNQGNVSGFNNEFKIVILEMKV